MKIENFSKKIINDKARVSATVIWEDRNRPPEEVFFETTAKFGNDLVINPNSWLLACTLVAMRYGEKRIAIDAPISAEIKDGLINSMRCLIDWHGGGATPRRLKAQGNAHLERKVISIEAPIEDEVKFLDKSPRAAGFFSGGIDALAMVRENHLNFPPGHPRHIQDGILVYGILEGENTSDPSFKHVIDAVSAMAEDAEIELIQVSTNAYAHFRDLDPDYSFWRLEYMSSFLAAIAHAFTPRFSLASIASTYDYANLEPWGSHPLLDPLYSSSNLQIRHENAGLSRLDKTKLVGEWDIALKHLRVCNEKESYSHGNYNCGKCGKCVKTMAAFLALDLLQQIPTFTTHDVSSELLIDNCYISDTYDESCYQELIEPLAKIGRQDLIKGINKITHRYHERDLKGLLKRFDRSLFGGNLFDWVKKQKSSLAS